MRTCASVQSLTQWDCQSPQSPEDFMMTCAIADSVGLSVSPVSRGLYDDLCLSAIADSVGLSVSPVSRGLYDDLCLSAIADSVGLSVGLSVSVSLFPVSRLVPQCSR